MKTKEKNVITDIPWKVGEGPKANVVRSKIGAFMCEARTTMVAKRVVVSVNSYKSLVKALRPFAKLLGQHHERMLGEQPIWGTTALDGEYVIITVEDVRRVHALLVEIDKENKS